jgi:hypothetical protein
MSNRCSQTVNLYGEAVKVKEVFDYIISLKTEEYEYDVNFFSTEAFPISLCSILREEERIILETRYGPPIPAIIELSKKYKEVGFRSGSFTDGGGEEKEHFILDGIIIYSQYLEVQGPDYWKKITGSSMYSAGYISEEYSLENKETNLEIPFDPEVFPEA